MGDLRVKLDASKGFLYEPLDASFALEALRGSLVILFFSLTTLTTERVVAQETSAALNLLV